MANSNATNRFATRKGKVASAATEVVSEIVPEVIVPEVIVPEVIVPEVIVPEVIVPEVIPPMAGPSAAEAEAALFQQRQALTIKACRGFTQKAKPQRKMLRRIAKMGVHPGMGLGIKRWHLYRVGMTMQEAKTTPGLCYLDLTFWEKNKLIVMRDCTDEEYAAELSSWEASKPKEVAVVAAA